MKEGQKPRQEYLLEVALDRARTGLFNRDPERVREALHDAMERLPDFENALAQDDIRAKRRQAYLHRLRMQRKHREPGETE